MKMHNGEKPYQCIQCDKPFSKQVNLNIYLRIHTGENIYPVAEVKHIGGTPTEMQNSHT